MSNIYHDRHSRINETRRKKKSCTGIKSVVAYKSNLKRNILFKTDEVIVFLDV